ncbi:interleukin-31 receptor subunit alpha isoform 2-T2 [Pholidichthys leucotaenia]
MVGHGLQLDSKCCSSTNCRHFLILGLMFAFYSTPSSQASTELCTPLISSKYQHCGHQQDGVHGLKCFGKHKKSHHLKCVWKPGNHSSEKIYTLLLIQGTKDVYCKIHYNITEYNKEINKSFRNKNDNMTVTVFENSQSENCTKDIFRGLPQNLLRCGPPHNASFSRNKKLSMNVSWNKDDANSIRNFFVRYKALGSLDWHKSYVTSLNRSTAIVENLNSSLVYIAQIQCVTNNKCTQCPWSETYTVSSELTEKPVIVSFKDVDIAEKGCHLIFITWKFSSTELFDGYHVTVGKVSGESPQEQINTSRPQITLILSGSAYHINISAVNNVSISPAVSLTIPARERTRGAGGGKLNVTVQSSSSVTISWEDDLIKKYVCFSVDWKQKGQSPRYKSFYQGSQNYKKLELSESLEPYSRYSLTLHTRPDKDTCNMKRVNNSESTYGTTQFYFTEGSPRSAPRNISSYNVTQNSVVLQWLSIPEEEIRGFLQGYIISYAEYHNNGTSAEKNITVDPDLHSYELGDLKSGTEYQVQICGFTTAGAGVRSAPDFFKTVQEGFHWVGIIIPFALVVTVLIGTPFIKRAKAVLLPSIPNPGNSSALQKSDGRCEMELLDTIRTLIVEEWETKSLQIVEREAAVPASTLPSMFPLLCGSKEDENSQEMTCNWIQTDIDDPSEDILPDRTTVLSLDTQQTALQSSPFAFPSGYTTIEMFQQGIPQGVTANRVPTTVVEEEPEDTDVTAVKAGFDYMRQFSTSPDQNSEQINVL